MLFLDFDGTISRADVVDSILEEFAGDGWRRIEAEWQAGRIGSRACLSAQMALVRATPDVLAAWIDSIELDPGLVPLLDVCARQGVDAHVVSDGFDFCINRLLSRLPAHGLSVSSSHLEPSALNAWRTAFPFYERECVHGCATCKPAVMQTLNPLGLPVIFVGDGLSDRYACEAADVVFAKSRLRAHCVERALPHLSYDGLADVAQAVDEAMSGGRRWREAADARA